MFPSSKLMAVQKKTDQFLPCMVPAVPKMKKTKQIRDQIGNIKQSRLKLPQSNINSITILQNLDTKLEEELLNITPCQHQVPNPPKASQQALIPPRRPETQVLPTYGRVFKATDTTKGQSRPFQAYFCEETNSAQHN